MAAACLTKVIIQASQRLVRPVNDYSDQSLCLSKQSYI